MLWFADLAVWLSRTRDCCVSLSSAIPEACPFGIDPASSRHRAISPGSPVIQDLDDFGDAEVTCTRSRQPVKANRRLDAFAGTDHGRLWVRGLAFPSARHLGRPFQWKNFHGTWVPQRQNSPLQKSSAISGNDPGLQIPRLRYSPGLAPTTRLNALLNAASDS